MMRVLPLQGQAVVPVSVPSQHRCKTEAVLVVVAADMAVAFVDGGEARSPDQSPPWHTADLR